VSFRTAIVESRKIKGDTTWLDFIRRSRTPELPVVLLEDAGALIGLILALIGVGLAALTGDVVWDGVGTLSIGILLVAISIVLTVEMKSLLIGEAATSEHIEAMSRAATNVPLVNRVIDLKTQHIGPEELLVAGKLEFTPSLTASEIAEAIDAAETSIRLAVPLAGRIYLEPDIWSADHVPNPDGPPTGADSGGH
jgi:divalent metal cation (Fe/Co/Zn/Cd) transporter